MFEIETKHLLALILLFGCGSVAMLATLFSQRLRDIGLFALVFGAVLIEKMDVTFLGTFWYRGTSRGVEVSAIDLVPLCLLVATMLFPRYPRGRLYWPAGLGLLVVYFLYCCGSVLASSPQLYGFWELTKMFRGILVFLAAALFVRTPRELAIVVGALGCTAVMEALNGLEQRFFKGAFRVPGTLDHENTLSTYLCMIAPVLLAAAMSNWSKFLRWFAGFAWLMAAGAELMTLSRLGIPVFGFVSIGTAVACTSWTLTKQKVAIITVVLVAIGVFLGFSWSGLKARYMQSSITAEFTDEHAFETRGVYWRLAFLMLEDHPYGVGLNNWSYHVGKTYGPDLGYAYHDYDEIKWIPTKDDAAQILLPPAADSLPALTLGELGYAGLILLLLVWLRWFQVGATYLRGRLNDDPMHRLAIGVLFGSAGIFLQSATEWTYRQTPVMFTCHALMGTLASLHYARKRARKEAKRAAKELDEQERMLPITAIRIGEPEPADQ